MVRTNRISGLIALLAFSIFMPNLAEACWFHHGQEGRCRWCERHQARRAAKRSTSNAQSAQSSKSTQADLGVQDSIPVGDILLLLGGGRDLIQKLKELKNKQTDGGGSGETDTTSNDSQLDRIEKLLKDGLKKSDEEDSRQTESFTEFGNDLEKRLKGIEDDVKANAKQIVKTNDEIGSLRDSFLEEDFVKELAKALAAANGGSTGSATATAGTEGTVAGKTATVKENTTVYDKVTGGKWQDNLNKDEKVSRVGKETTGRVQVEYTKDGKKKKGYVDSGNLQFD